MTPAERRRQQRYDDALSFIALVTGGLMVALALFVWLTTHVMPHL